MIRRRALLATLGAAPLVGARAMAQMAHSSPSAAPDYTIIAGGPPGGRIDRWSRVFSTVLHPFLGGRSTVRVAPTGGLDGVTAANRLQALVVPDGMTAALLPGEAAIAFLTVDPRAHFLPGDWIPVVAGLGSLLLVVRGGTARLSSSTPLRFAAASLESPDLAGLLGLAKLGVPVAPIFGLNDPAAVTAAFAQGEADAALFSGEDVAADAAPLSAEGGVVICTLVGSGSGRKTARDSGFMDVPTLDELAAQRSARPLPRPLDAAYRSVVAASRIDFMMVLPRLSSPAAIALWRSAGARSIVIPAVEDAASASAVRLVAGADAVTNLAPLTVGSDAVLALHAFLAREYGWHRS